MAGRSMAPGQEEKTEASARATLGFSAMLRTVIGVIPVMTVELMRK